MAAASSSDSSADLETDELLRSSELFTNVEWNLSRVLKGFKKKIKKMNGVLQGVGLNLNTGQVFYCSTTQGMRSMRAFYCSVLSRGDGSQNTDMCSMRVFYCSVLRSWGDLLIEHRTGVLPS